jgi:FtsZ-interacting cell division protein ZipA
MMNKETLIKIAVALVVIAVVWLILKSRKKRKIHKPRKVIVTSMPKVEKYDDIDDDDDSIEEEGYAEWQSDEQPQEGFEELSPVEYKSELLD